MHALAVGRRIALPALVTFCLLATCCGGREEVRLSVSPTHVDFGRILHGDATDRVVTLHNRRAHDVTVTGTSFNCSCFRLHPFRKMLHPGDTREIKITFISGAVPPGELRGKQLDILSDDPLYPRIDVPLAGEIVGSVTLSESIVDLGALADPKSREPFVIRLRPALGMTVTVGRWSVEPADLLEATATDAEGGKDFEIRLKEDASGTGALAGWLNVRVVVTGEGLAERSITRTVRIQGEWPTR